MNEIHVVLGAGGGAGGAVVRALADGGRAVRAVTRSGGRFPDGVEDVRADARDAGAVVRACAGAGVVYHCVNVPYAEWEALLPGIMDAV
ncbi:MAG: NAD-dependent epimerase/dehydratase family protein, partial [Gemmatimonadota bacterium]